MAAKRQLTLSFTPTSVTAVASGKSSTEAGERKRKKGAAGDVEDPERVAEFIEKFNGDWWRERIGPSWYNALQSECTRGYLLTCLDRVEKLRTETKRVYPPAELVFKAFTLTPLDRVKVVIVGQDPYYGDRQAMGLCFSVPRGIRCPPSLINIVKEILGSMPDDQNILPCDAKPAHGDLTAWASQGVFLLNALLTVESSKPLSHKNFPEHCGPGMGTVYGRSHRGNQSSSHQCRLPFVGGGRKEKGRKYRSEETLCVRVRAPVTFICATLYRL